MSKAGGTDTATVWSVATVRNQVDTHLSLGSFNSAVGLAWWDRVTFTEQLKICLVNEIRNLFDYHSTLK